MRRRIAQVLVGTLAAPAAAALVAGSAVAGAPVSPPTMAPGLSARPRCSFDPRLAARHVIPPPPFSVRGVVVTRLALPPSDPAGKAPRFTRLFSVRFVVTRGNAVLPAGHAYTQFAYVGRSSPRMPWCYLKGGSGP